MMKQMKYSERQNIVNEFIKRNDPYSSKPMQIDIDIHKYASFAKENNLKGSEITPEILKMF